MAASGACSRALDHYEADMKANLLAHLMAKDSPRAALAELLHATAKATAEDGVRGGCLTVNNVLEVAPHDAEVKARVARSLDRLEGLLRVLVLRSMEAGETDPAVAPQEAACALLGLILGLRVLTFLHPVKALPDLISMQVGAILPLADPSAECAVDDLSSKGADA